MSAPFPPMAAAPHVNVGTGHVLVVTEHRFVRTPDGRCWSEGSGHWQTWQRLLPAPHGTGPFARVTLAARVTDAPTPPEGAREVAGPALTVTPLPGYLGPRGYLRVWRRLRAALAALARDSQFDLVLLRQPGPLGAQMAAQLRRVGKPWVCEVVGDPEEVFAAGASRHPLRRFFAWQFARHQRRIVAEARGVVYVSEALQTRYPTPVIQGVASNVDLPPEAFRPPPPPAGATGPWRLGLIGSLEQPYKGVDTAIQMLAQLRQQDGLAVTLRIIGAGALRAEYTALATTLGVADAVEWTGALPAGAAVRAALGDCDLYLQPSRTEGLPRALLEAMAWGLPAFGTPVGGIPEVLPAARLLPVGDASAWARAVAADLRDAAARHTAAEAGHAHAQRWARARLAAVRQMVYASSLRHVVPPIAPYTAPMPSASESSHAS